MRRVILFYILSIFTFLVIVPEASAQFRLERFQSKPLDKDEQAEYEAMVLKDYEYTEKDIDQLNFYYRQCYKTGSAQYYNCQCLATKQLNKWIVYDNTKTRQAIFREVAPDCIDTTTIAGNIYTECSSIGEFDSRWSDEFCECYANEYALSVKETGGTLGRRGAITARSNAMQECNFNAIIMGRIQEAQQERRRRAVELSGQAQRRLDNR